MRAKQLLALITVASIGVGIGCFGRTGLSDEDLEAIDGPLPGPDVEAGVDSGIVIITDTATSPDTLPPKEDARGERFIDIWEVFPIPEGGPIGDCAGCVRDKCGAQVNACINDPVCVRGLGCTVTNCLGGGGGVGGFDFACVTKCFGGDLKTAAKAISTFTCVIGQCGAKCGGFLGGLPGGGGGGGTPPGTPADAGKPTPSADAAKTPGFAPESDFFSGEWDEARVQSIDPKLRLGFSKDAYLPWAHEIEAACAADLQSCAPRVP